MEGNSPRPSFLMIIRIKMIHFAAPKEEVGYCLNETDPCRSMIGEACLAHAQNRTIDSLSFSESLLPQGCTPPPVGLAVFGLCGPTTIAW